jgi:hypothetical protein
MCEQDCCVCHEEQTHVKSVSKKHDGKNKQRQEEQTFDFNMKRKPMCWKEEYCVFRKLSCKNEKITQK